MSANTLDPAVVLQRAEEVRAKQNKRAADRAGQNNAQKAALGNIGSLFGTANNAAATAVVNAAATAVANAKGPTELNVSVGKNKFKAVITKVVGGRRNKTNGGKRKRSHHKRTRRNKRRGTRRNKRN